MNERQWHDEQGALPPDVAQTAADIESVARAARGAADSALEARVYAASVERLNEQMPADVAWLGTAMDELALSESRSHDTLAASVFAASVGAIGTGAARQGGAVTAGTDDRRSVLASIGGLLRSRSVRIAAAMALLVAGGVVAVQIRNERIRRAEVDRLAAQIDNRLEDLFATLEAADSSETADASLTSDDETERLDVYLRSLEGRL